VTPDVEPTSIGRHGEPLEELGRNRTTPATYVRFIGITRAPCVFTLCT
jgi:hypothetical protein